MAFNFKTFVFIIQKKKKFKAQYENLKGYLNEACTRRPAQKEGRVLFNNSIKEIIRSRLIQTKTKKNKGKAFA